MAFIHIAWRARQKFARVAQVSDLITLTNEQVTVSLTTPVSTPNSVVGPASATDNALPRYDATTGKLIQDSGIIVDDSDNM